jgi:hypothetical protein
MEIIVETESRIQTYEVVIDEERLKEVLASLDKECSVIKCGRRQTEAYDKPDAYKNISSMTNHAGEKENLDYEIKGIVEGQYWYHGLPKDAYYDAVYKCCTELVDDINIFYECKDEYEDIAKEALQRILTNSYCEDFIPFEKRVEIAEAKINDAINNNNKGLLEAVREYQEAVVMLKFNPNYDFNRLAELYKEVLNCFNKILVEETIKYRKR